MNDFVEAVVIIRKGMAVKKMFEIEKKKVNVLSS